MRTSVAFTDVVQPTSHLTAPQQPAEWSSPFKTLNELGDLISPSYWVSEIIDMAFGFNPKDKAQEYLAGDWEAYAKCGEAWSNLGMLCADVGRNIEAGNSALDSTWEGNAADAAFIYFKTIAEKCDDLQSELDSLKGQYDTISRAVWAAGQAVGTLISQIGDMAAIAATYAAAGTLLSWTGWGAAVGYGAAAIQIARMIELWGEVTKQVNNAQLLAQAAVALIAGAGGSIATKFADFPLPGNAYDSSAV